jgi:S-adenosyl-L-methionine hydrolase (adenosine-forming)
MSRQIITITTDFQPGYSSALIEGVIRANAPEVDVVRVTDSIRPFNIQEGTFVLWDLARFYPTDTIHIGVVDPGVGTDRKICSVKTKCGTFVGPYNGLFDLPISRFGLVEAFSYPREQFTEASNTFHGRDIFSKIAVDLATGKFNFEREPLDYKILNLIDNVADEEAVVVHIDGFGNIKLNKQVKAGQQIKLIANDQTFEARKVSAFHEAKDGELILYKGSSEVDEIAVVDGNAGEYLNVSIGDAIQIV